VALPKRRQGLWVRADDGDRHALPGSQAESRPCAREGHQHVPGREPGPDNHHSLRGIVVVWERRVGAQQSLRCGRVDVDEVKPDGRLAVTLELLGAQQQAQVRVHEVHDTLQAARAASAGLLAGSGRDLDVRGIVAAQHRQVAGRPQPGTPLRRRAARITDDNQPADGPHSVELGVPGIGLDHHHPVATVQERLCEQSALASQAGYHHMITDELQPH